MSNFVDNVKTLLKRTIAYVFQPKEKKMANEVERIREKYEKYDKVRLNNFLIGYKSQVKQLQLVFISIFTFIGISAVFFRTLLGYFGQQTFYWFNLLLISGTSMSASAIAKLTSDDIRMLLLVDSIFVVAILIVFIFVLLILIEKIKLKQLKILILEDCIKMQNIE